MSAENPSAVHGHGHDVPCPDPSVHERKDRLSEQASTAALYVTQPERHTEAKAAEKQNPLGPDGKLSSKGAAASLKYAQAQDLPSFPSSGNAANSASKAAMLAKDYKMKDLWHPELSAAGSKAALLAHEKGGKLDLWQPSATADGNSAATIAMRNKNLSPQLDYGYTVDGKSRALLAATKSVSMGRARAESTPQPVHPAYPDSRNAGANALSAATVSHKASTAKSAMAPDGWGSPANQAARITNIGANMDRAMFTEHPPVAIERDEAQHNAALHASAITMAKKMYDQQAQTPGMDPAGAGASSAHARNPGPSQQTDLKQEAMRYIHLQEAAHKLAAERLAKVDKKFEQARYREYYGYGGAEEKPKRMSKKLSMGGRRKRASSEADADMDSSDDEEQARRIRSQMSQLSTGMSTVDANKQSSDRAKLMAAAEKRVSARMHDMDEQVFLDTGKVPPAMMEEWENKARKRAQEEKAEQAQHPGKTHIGGGKYMDQSAIEAIAAARLKPTLDEINDTAEKKRARDEEIRLEKEEQDRTKREEKAKQREEKDEQKRVKNEEKAASKKEKEEAKARQQEDKRKSREVKWDNAAEVAAGATLAEVANKVKDDKEPAAEPSAQTGVEKHRSALGRLKDKFTKGGKRGSDSKTEQTPDTSSPGTAAGVVSGARVGAVAQPSQPLDSQQAAHAVVDTEEESEDDFQPAPTSLAAPATTEYFGSDPKITGEPSAVTGSAPAEDLLKPTRPRFEQSSSMTDLYTDSAPSQSKPRMPNLERHISQIPVDSDDSESDWDSDEDPTKKKSVFRHEAEVSASLPHHQAEIIAARAVTAPVVHESTIDPVAQDSLFASAARAHDAVEPTEATAPIAQETIAPPVPIAAAPVAKDPIASSAAPLAEPAIPSTGGQIPPAVPVIGGLRDTDDASLSGVDEESVQRGRAGRLAQKLGLGKIKGKKAAAAAAAPATGVSSEAKPGHADNESTTEEARDTFDESLAPAPAFAGQEKDASPVRGTRFQEEL